MRELSTYAGRYQTPTLNLARDKQSSYVSPNIPVQYNGEIAYKEKGGVAINKVPNLQFQYCLANNGKIIGQEWLPGMPRTLGTYYIRAIAPRNDVGEEERYEQVYSEPVQFKVIYYENERPRIVGSSFNLDECIAKFSYLDLIYSRLTGNKGNKSYNYRNFIIAILAYYNAINNK